MNDPALSPCPRCSADWRRTELMGAARRGGGYRVHCHVCGHEWDDVHASHGRRETAMRREAALGKTVVDLHPPLWRRVLNRALGGTVDPQ